MVDLIGRSKKSQAPNYGYRTLVGSLWSQSGGSRFLSSSSPFDGGPTRWGRVSARSQSSRNGDSIASYHIGPKSRSLRWSALTHGNAFIVILFGTETGKTTGIPRFTISGIASFRIKNASFGPYTSHGASNGKARSRPDIQVQTIGKYLSASRRR